MPLPTLPTITGDFSKIGDNIWHKRGEHDGVPDLVNKNKVLDNYEVLLPGPSPPPFGTGFIAVVRNSNNTCSTVDLTNDDHRKQLRMALPTDWTDRYLVLKEGVVVFPTGKFSGPGNIYVGTSGVLQQTPDTGWSPRVIFGIANSPTRGEILPRPVILPIDVIEHFGAKADGVTDDTAAIQAAIDTGLPISFAKDKVFGFTALTYNTAGQKITGGGTLKHVGVHSNFGNTVSANNVIFEDVEIDGSDTLSKGMDVEEGFTGFTARNCYFHNFRQPVGVTTEAVYGVYLRAACTDYVFEGCRFEEIHMTESEGSATRGILVAGASQPTVPIDGVIRNCRFKNISCFKAVMDADAIFFQADIPPTHDRPWSAVVENCTFINPGKRAIKCQVHGLHASGNNIYMPLHDFGFGDGPRASTDVAIAPQLGHALIENNYIEGEFVSHMVALGAGYVINNVHYIGNTFVTPDDTLDRNTQYNHARFFQRLQDCTFTNNTFRGQAKNGIRVGQSLKSCSFTNNHFQDIELSGVLLSLEHNGTSTAAGASDITLAATEQSRNGFFVGAKIKITAGPGVGELKTILTYDGTTKVATVDSAWTTPPTASSYDIGDLEDVSFDGNHFNGSIQRLFKNEKPWDSTFRTIATRNFGVPSTEFHNLGPGLLIKGNPGIADFDGAVDIRDYGAISGEDSSSAFAAALGTLRDVYIPADGVFPVGTLSLSNANQRIIGKGTIQHTGTHVTTWITITANGVVIDGPTIDGNQSANFLIRIEDVDDVTIQNCHLTGAAQPTGDGAVACQAVQVRKSADNFSILNCLIDDIYAENGNDARGIAVEPIAAKFAGSGRIEGNTIRGLVADVSPFDSWGIYIDTFPSEGSYDIRGNRIEDCHGMAIRCETQGVRIKNNKLLMRPYGHGGLAVGGGATEITLAATASGDDDTYNTMTIEIISTGERQVISDYVGATKVATTGAWTTEPVAGDKYRIYERTALYGISITNSRVTVESNEILGECSSAMMSIGDATRRLQNIYVRDNDVTIFPGGITRNAAVSFVFANSPLLHSQFGNNNFAGIGKYAFRLAQYLESLRIIGNFIEELTEAAVFLQILESDTAQAGGASDITLASGSSSNITDFYVGASIRITSGTAAGEEEVITAFDPGTDIATVANPWGVTPDGTSVYQIDGRRGLIFSHNSFGPAEVRTVIETATTTWDGLKASVAQGNIVKTELGFAVNANLLSMSGNRRIDTGIAFADQFLTRTANTGITASATQTQGQAPLTANINIISTVVNTNDVVTLPAATDDITPCKVVNTDSTETLQIFPASGDAIDGGATDASITLAAGATIVLDVVDTTNWYS